MIAEAGVHFSSFGASEKLPSAGSADDYLDFAWGLLQKS